MFGRQARLPVDVAFGLPPNSEASHNTFAASLRTTLQEALKVFTQILGTISSVRKKFMMSKPMASHTRREMWYRYIMLRLQRETARNSISRGLAPIRLLKEYLMQPTAYSC